MQPDEPAFRANEPDGQATHDDEPTPAAKRPDGHEAHSALLDSSEVNLPIGHEVHSAEAVAFAYVPAAHETHVEAEA